MAKPEWGSKRTCYSCAARFYDLRRSPIVCPVCGTVHDPERVPKPKRPLPGVKDEPVLAARANEDELAPEAIEEEIADSDAAEVDLEELDESEDAEAGEDSLTAESGDLMEDTSELGEDDDDIGEVMEHVDDEVDDKP